MYLMTRITPMEYEKNNNTIQRIVIDVWCREGGIQTNNEIIYALDMIMSYAEKEYSFYADIKRDRYSIKNTQSLYDNIYYSSIRIDLDRVI